MAAGLQTSVTIIGGSIVGLSSALFLAAHKVPVILIERHKGSSPHPRAIGWTHRSMELFRSVGLEEAIALQSGSAHGKPRRVKATSLNGEWSEESQWAKPGVARGSPPKIDFSSITPVHDVALSQDKLEPILRARILELGGNLRLGCTMTEWSEDADGVTVAVTSAEGHPLTVRSKYLIACDGARSRIRADLGIPGTGVGYLRTLRSILFRCAPIDHHLPRGIHQWAISNPHLEAFLVTYSDGRWALMTNSSQSDAPLLTEAEQKTLILHAIGHSPDADKPITAADIEILTHGKWDLAGSVATRFSSPSGRTFFAGDAAHTLPPNRGGYGANTGIADAHNLAWKLASVLSGFSTPSLLETYDAERRPAALVRHDQIFVREDYRGYVAGSEWERENKGVEVLDDVAIELGQVYQSSAAWFREGKGEGLPVARTPGEWRGQPGTRAPHVEMIKGDGRDGISTLDLFGREWVLLSEEGGWRSKVDGCRFVLVGVDAREVKEDEFRERFGLEKSGAVLVRPDGYIAARWETMPQDVKGTFRRDLFQVTHRPEC